jgi:hypothetical protein
MGRGTAAVDLGLTEREGRAISLERGKKVY